MPSVTISKIPVQAYRKSDLRKLLLTPDLDLKDAKAVAEAPMLPHRRWYNLLNDKLAGKVPDEEWKTVFYLSKPVVAKLLE